MVDIKQLSKVWDGLARQWTKLKSLPIKKEYVDFCGEEEKAIVEFLKDKKDLKILDVGCGCGRIIEKIPENNGKVYGIDVSIEMLKMARKKLPDSVVLIHQDITEKWPFKDEFFDLITCTGNVLGNVENQEAVLKESERCLKKKGVMFFGVFNADNLDEKSASEVYNGFEAPFKLAKYDEKSKTVYFDGGNKAHWFTKEEVSGLFSGKKFTPKIEGKGIGFLLMAEKCTA